MIMEIDCFKQIIVESWERRIYNVVMPSNDVIDSTLLENSRTQVLRYGEA